MSRFIVKDTFFKKAKKDGFRARSAYKLKEIQDKYHVIKAGDSVLDIGCAPGSFLQVLATMVGSAGIVAGIDILPVSPLPYKNVHIFRGDIRDTEIRDITGPIDIPCFDAMTCDIAPNLTGIKEVDEKNRGEMYEAVKRIMKDGLKRGGHLIFKSFFTEGFKPVTEDLKSMFQKTVIYKPAASRSISSEVYLICFKMK